MSTDDGELGPEPETMAGLESDAADERVGAGTTMDMRLPDELRQPERRKRSTADYAERHADAREGERKVGSVTRALEAIRPPGAPGPGRRRADTLPGIQDPQTLRGRVKKIVRSYEERVRALEAEKRRVRYPLWVLRVTVQVFRQWARDRCPQQAASLAFQTLLSIVPFIAVCLAVLRATDSLGEQSTLVEFLAGNLIPFSQETISDQLLSWSANVNMRSLGLVGLITTVLLAFIMVNSLERVANYIWRAEKKRSVAQKFVVFYASATIGPFLIGAGLYQAAKVGLTEGYAGLGLSFLTSLLALFLANYFLPAVQVRWKPAMVGALVSTILFELSKVGFSLYVGVAGKKFTGIYGAVAVAPLWLLWIYYGWLTMLLGFEIAHAVQNIHLLERVDRRGTMSLENELVYRVNGVVASRVMVSIVEAYVRGDKVMSRRRLEDRFDLSDEVVTRITDRLKAHDLIIEVEGEHNGFLPARPPHEITLAKVMAAFRGEDVLSAGPGSARTKLDKVLTDMEADTLQRTGRLTLDQLI